MRTHADSQIGSEKQQHAEQGIQIPCYVRTKD